MRDWASTLLMKNKKKPLDACAARLPASAPKLQRESTSSPGTRHAMLDGPGVLLDVQIRKEEGGWHGAGKTKEEEKMRHQPGGRGAADATLHRHGWHRRIGDIDAGQEQRLQDNTRSSQAAAAIHRSQTRARRPFSGGGGRRPAAVCEVIRRVCTSILLD